MTDDPAELLRRAADLGRYSRRRFLVGAAAGLTLATDLFVTRLIQEGREELEILPVRDDEATTRFPRSMWFLFPGYKTSWEEAVWILNSLRPALASRGQMAAVGYSNKGLDLDTIEAEVFRYIRTRRINRVYFYGHSFGGMVAVEIAARLLARGVQVEIIILDSSPSGRFDVLDAAMIRGVVFLYEAGYQVPSAVRGGYELGERILHKDERSWSTIADQTLEQLSPLAPSSTLIQSESSYIYHYDAGAFAGGLGKAEIAYIGNPEDTTVNYHTARQRWTELFPQNMVSNALVTEGARPAHASPQWNPVIYQQLVQDILDTYAPLPATGGGGSKVPF
ncbi:thioesterase domain-containing protein [Arthrobacter sp.]|uniref:thioesterase domain-containing protein n=1 Tax=Arthrobacter sp. TaxID=1667 RepID=UPI00289CC103|nr:thioesterase domain-containing protein [Arthrobacter sp.]